MSLSDVEGADDEVQLDGTMDGDVEDLDDRRCLGSLVHCRFLTHSNQHDYPVGVPLNPF